MDGWAHLNLDNAWGELVPAPTVDAMAWGPRLRYLTKSSWIHAFHNQVAAGLPNHVVYGSGDFHHLTAVLLRRFDRPVHVICFDNHPDWDLRPPRWACGAWVNRALELPQVRSVTVWGCGNFELRWPGRLTGNLRAIRDGRLSVLPWAERQPADVQKTFACVTRENWQDRFSDALTKLKGQDVYVTVDLDCLRRGEAVTNWENGCFTAADVAWAVTQIRRNLRLVGGDVCGAWSKPVFATRFQRLAAWWDHPKVSVPDPAEALRGNRHAFDAIRLAMVTA
jgi:hypothetical protein